MPVAATGGSESDCALRFSALGFNFSGLDCSQRARIRARHGPASSRMAGPAIPVQVSCRSFRAESPARYTGPNGYQPLLSHSADAVAVEGLDFRGRVILRPQLSGQLVCDDAARLAEPGVYENFLRILTAYALLPRGGVLLHSAAVVEDGKVHVFIGRSGAGKTTLSRLALAGGVAVLSDDANVLLKAPGGGYAAGAVPFAGELGQIPQQAVGPFPVAGLFWLEKAARSQVLDMNPALQVARLMTCAPALNVDPHRRELLLDRLSDLVREVPLRCLRFSATRGFEEIRAQLRAANSVSP